MLFNLSGMIRIFTFYILFVLAGTSLPVNLSTSDIPTNQEPDIRIGIIADVQYCDCDSNGSRYYAESLNKLQEAVNEFNKYPLDYVISMGDLIDRDYNSLDKVLPIMAGSKAKVYHMIGNHDQEVKNSLKDSVLIRLTNPKGYYSFSSGVYRFIVLNTFDINTGSTDPDKRQKANFLMEELKKEGAINAHEWNGGIGGEQMKWLIDELVIASNSNQKTIIFSHHPVWPQSTLNFLNYMELLDIINSFNNVICWFSGHKHEGGYGNISKIHCVNLKGMVETKSQNAFSIIEIYNNKIWIKGYGREKSQILAY